MSSKYTCKDCKYWNCNDSATITSTEHGYTIIAHCDFIKKKVSANDCCDVGPKLPITTKLANNKDIDAVMVIILIILGYALHGFVGWCQNIINWLINLF